MDQKEKCTRLQQNLRTIRSIAGWTAAELGEKIGMSKQTVSNLEIGRAKMSLLYYLAIRTVLDDEINANPENIALSESIHILLDMKDEQAEEMERLVSAVFSVAAAAVGGIRGDKLNELFIQLVAPCGRYGRYLEQKYKHRNSISTQQ